MYVCMYVCRLAHSEVTVNSLEPGTVKTNLYGPDLYFRAKEINEKEVRTIRAIRAIRAIKGI